MIVYQPIDGDTVILGAVLRLGPDYAVHENSTHANVGVTGLSINWHGELVVNCDVPLGARVVCAMAEEDETLAELGVQCGISGGLSTSVIRFYQNGVKVRADSPLFGPTANVWFSLILFVPNT